MPETEQLAAFDRLEEKLLRLNTLSLGSAFFVKFPFGFRQSADASLRGKAEEQYLREVELPPRRGRILDRNCAELASTADVLGMPAPDAQRLIQHSLFTLEGGQAAAGALIASGCTAIVCASDMMALGAIRTARALGLSVPRDVSVVGFDDSTLIAFTDPPLTTIRQPVAAMSQAAVNALLEEIGGTPAPHSEFVFLPELVVRGSTAAVPASDRSAGNGMPGSTDS